MKFPKEAKYLLVGRSVNWALKSLSVSFGWSRDLLLNVIELFGSDIYGFVRLGMVFHSPIDIFLPFGLPMVVKKF